MAYQHRGEVEITELMAFAIGLVMAAIILYVWTQGIPTETQTLNASIT